MKKKLVILAILALILIAATYANVLLHPNQSTLIGCKTDYEITNERPLYGYQIIKVHCVPYGYNPTPRGPVDYFCGETNKCDQ